MNREIQYHDIFADLTTAAHRAYTRGIQTGSGGNLSARIPDQDAMIVKNSGGSFADCTETGKGWIAMEFGGGLLAGEAGKPTREWRLHGALLQALPQVGAVVHCHSPYSIAWADQHPQIPLATLHSGLKFGCEIPVVDVPYAVVPEEALPGIIRLFEENPNLPAFVLRGHGIVAVGKNAIAAEHAAELVEETAQIAFLQSLLKR